ncbi:MAG: response regulator [Leptolyngbyaceae bacterium]|nr:response regulator [Leptolyngbyaceae bacterium]
MFDGTHQTDGLEFNCSVPDVSIPDVAVPCEHCTQSPLTLLADDDEDNLLLISYAMELLGVNFIAARTGQEVMELVRRHSFSLIVLDIRLPDIDGVELCSWLRQNPVTKDSPIIAVTAMARLSDRDSIMAAGFTDYLLKPYMIEDLNTLILKHLHDELQASP